MFFEENTMRFAIYFIENFFIFFISFVFCFFCTHCTLDTDTVLAHASSTNWELALGNSGWEQREAPRMEGVSCVGLSGSRGSDITKGRSSQNTPAVCKSSDEQQTHYCPHLSTSLLAALVCSLELKKLRKKKWRAWWVPASKTICTEMRNYHPGPLQPAAHLHISRNINLLWQEVKWGGKKKQHFMVMCASHLSCASRFPFDFISARRFLCVCYLLLLFFPPPFNSRI